MEEREKAVRDAIQKAVDEENESRSDKNRDIDETKRTGTACQEEIDAEAACDAEVIDDVEAEDDADDAVSEAGSADPGCEGDDKKKKSSIFKKKPKKDKRDEQIEELNDKLIRQMAEFDNFRKRGEKEKSQMFEVGAKSIIEKILPVVDNFERGFDMLSEEEKKGPFAQGMDKIYKQMVTSLEEMGVVPIEAVGNEFDPNFHNAVMHEENDEFGENIISQEFQKGYMYRDTVVRHSMVKVAN